MCWDNGRMILDRQEHAGWGAKVVDRLAAAWQERAIVQEPLARVPLYHHIALLDKLTDPAERLLVCAGGERARIVAQHGHSKPNADS